jgi:transcriptional antiterminator RfaH
LLLRWYLIHTKPSAEGLAQANLERQGYETYLPRLLQLRLWPSRERRLIVPLFPRYLFLRLNEGLQPLNPVRSTLGVAAVVRFGSCYTVVPDRVICELQSRADPVSGLHELRRAAPLVAGTPVTVREGLFSGLNGIFERPAAAERVVVLLRLLGQEASVCVPLDAVAAC